MSALLGPCRAAEQGQAGPRGLATALRSAGHGCTTAPTLPTPAPSLTARPGVLVPDRAGLRSQRQQGNPSAAGVRTRLLLSQQLAMLRQEARAGTATEDLSDPRILSSGPMACSQPPSDPRMSLAEVGAPRHLLGAGQSLLGTQGCRREEQPSQGRWQLGAAPSQQLRALLTGVFLSGRTELRGSTTEPRPSPCTV